ncbi:type I restriction enzyme, S subunit [Pseudomonas chlororaphis]|uniref:restriction endonuclease subunit S n=1 Tax=Pseudomonas chlororaphis TaxID=587753 RepID=UPI0039E5C58C
MSSKTKTTSAMEDSTPVLVPKLRFPEFREAEGWESIPLNRLAVRAKQKNRSAQIDRVLTNSAEFGVVDQRDFFNKDIATQGKLEGYFVVEFGSYVYNPRISSAAPAGPISKNKIGTGVMSPLYTVFKFKDDRNDFYEHFFKTTGWHTYMRQASSTGARHDRMAISSDDFMAMPLPVSSPDEQQKIADCLNLLDELIAAQGRKVDALKTHKKGLMHQLFPREGETQPRLRFPEFQCAGEWDAYPFESFVAKSFYGTSSSTSPTGQYPVLRMGNMSDGGLDFTNLVYIDLDPDSFESFRLEDGDILLNRTNSPALVGKVSLFGLKSECITASYIVTYRLNKKRIDPAFCNFMLNTSLYQARIKKLAKPSISQANINPTTFKKELVVSVPAVLEQQRIADCLTSLDELIGTQIQKLEAFKTHKKGLMQQLFPSMEVVEA